uniref:Uncharacterized protein n=1 Tax=Octopus bimaculoides TaxID=37653 RepID=A0A0L8H4I7_OCTBM
MFYNKCISLTDHYHNNVFISFISYWQFNLVCIIFITYSVCPGECFILIVTIDNSSLPRL